MAKKSYTATLHLEVNVTGEAASEKAFKKKLEELSDSMWINFDHTNVNGLEVSFNGDCPVDIDDWQIEEG